MTYASFIARQSDLQCEVVRSIARFSNDQRLFPISTVDTSVRFVARNRHQLHFHVDQNVCGSNRVRDFARVGRRQDNDCLFPYDAKRVVPIFFYEQLFRQANVMDDRFTSVDHRAADVSLRPRLANFSDQGACRTFVASNHSFHCLFPSVNDRHFSYRDLRTLSFQGIFTRRRRVSFQFQLRLMSAHVAQPNDPHFRTTFSAIVNGGLFAVVNGLFRAVSVNVASTSTLIEEGVRRRR